MTVSIWQDGNSDKPVRQCDIAIVGGGIAGAAAAYWIKQRNQYKTTIIEQAGIASGASGRNAGFILRGIVAYYNQTVNQHGRATARDILAFNEETLLELAKLAARHGQDFDYAQSGSYLLACSLEELQDLEESAQLMFEDGFAVEYLKQDPLNRGYYGALLNPGDAAVHPVRLTQLLVKLSEAEVVENQQVFKISQTASCLRLETDKSIIECEKALLTTNVYSALFTPYFSHRVYPVRAQALVTRPLDKILLDRLCYANYGYEYFRQLPDRRLLLGGCRQMYAEQEIGFADTITAPIQKSLRAYLKDRFPEAAGIPVDYAWSGLMGFTRDGLPMLGQLPEHENAFFAVGCNGHGMGYSLALSKLLVEHALDGASPMMFDANRPALAPQLV